MQEIALEIHGIHENILGSETSAAVSHFHFGLKFGLIAVWSILYFSVSWPYVFHDFINDLLYMYI